MIEVKTCDDSLHAYKNHVHEELSLGIVQRGSTNLNVYGKDYCINAGEAIIIYPFVSHMCRPVDLNDWSYTMVYVDPVFIKGLLEYRKASDLIGIIKLNKNAFIEIKKLVDILKSDVDRFIKEVELTSLLIDLTETVDIHIKMNTEQPMNQTITDLKFYIDSHFLETLCLDELESRFNANKFAMIRNFKSLFNTTPSAYQLQLKINHGKSLLKHSDDIVNIALNAGFYDQAHFTKEFKKAYGITPLQYYKSIHTA